MTERKFIKDILLVAVSNGIALLCGIITGFLLPKVLGVEEYAYYKIFTLYLTYTCLLHFGFTDGILLKHGGNDYTSLDKRLFRTYTFYYSLLEVIVALIMLIVGCIFLRGQERFILVALAFDTFFLNITSYFQFISQSTMRFKELSLRKILLNTARVIIVVGMVLAVKEHIISSATYFIYVVGILFIDLAMTIWYMYTYREIVIGNRYQFSDIKNSFYGFFKSGIILTISYQISNIIFALDRQYVSILFDKYTYGIYAFAYSLIAIIVTIIGAVSLVLFPNLKKLSEDNIIHTFDKAMGLITILAFAALITYYPLKFIVHIVLPNYIDSIQYFQVLFPGLALTSCINIIMFTYFKVLNKHIAYFKLSCIILGLAIVTNAVAYYIFRSPLAISVASIITMIVWYMLCVRYFVVNHNFKWKKIVCYTFIEIFIFYMVTLVISVDWVGFIIQIFAYGVITVFFYKSYCNDIIHQCKRLFVRGHKE